MFSASCCFAGFSLGLDADFHSLSLSVESELRLAGLLGRKTPQEAVRAQHEYAGDRLSLVEQGSELRSGSEEMGWTSGESEREGSEYVTLGHAAGLRHRSLVSIDESESAKVIVARRRLVSSHSSQLKSSRTGQKDKEDLKCSERLE